VRAEWPRRNFPINLRRVFGCEEFSFAKIFDCVRISDFENVSCGIARSTRDLLNTLDAIGKAGASFQSLGDSWANTDTPHGRLMLTVLGGLAEFERHLILARTSDGRKHALARGVRFGRKPKPTAHQQREALERRARVKPWLTSPGATL